MKAIWQRVDAHLHSVPVGVPQLYGAVIGLLVFALLSKLEPSRFGINWTSAVTLIGLSALLGIGSSLYRRSRSGSSSS